MPDKRRKKMKLKNPANLICAILILVGSIVLSLVIRQNFFLVFISAFLIYVAAYLFFEKKRLAPTEDVFEDGDVTDDEDDYAPPRRRMEPSQRSSFDVMRTAKFKDAEPEETVEDSVGAVSEYEEVEAVEEEDSWRSMYSQLSESDDSSFEEEYKRYFSTTLPDREEIARAQNNVKTSRDSHFHEEPKSPTTNPDMFDAESSDPIVESSQSSGDDDSEESDEDDEEGHILEADYIENKTLEIQHKVDDLLSRKAPNDAILAKSITAKLKFFKKTKTRTDTVESYDEDDTISSSLQLIDELYTEDAVIDNIKDVSFEEEYAEESPVSAETVAQTEPVPPSDSISDKIIWALKQADVDASIKYITKGASIIRYDVRPRSMSKLNRILKLENKLEETLEVGSVRVVDVGTNRSLAGIELPNPDREVVSFQDCISSNTFQMNHSTTSCVLGKDVYGEIVLADLKNLTHLLIVGDQAEEKNMCMHTLVASILSKVGVFHVDFLMIDISQRQLNVYDAVPHMRTPVLNFADDALAELATLEELIDTRLEMFQRNNARDIVSYNATKPETPLSRILVFINELEDLMAHDANAAEQVLTNILQKAKNAGVHLIVGVSNSDKEVLTESIKSNITSKICFAVDSADASEWILGMTGAEKLLGEGDMLYYPKGCLAPKRLQGSYIAQEEIEQLIDSIL